MHAVIIDEPGSVRVAEVASGEPARGEVRVRVELVGICATDAHILHGSFPTARYPARPGHEIVGIVDAVGPDVSVPTVGERVVVDPGVPCGHCRLCRQGRLNLCENRQAVGITLDGGAAEFLTVAAANCHTVAAGTDARTAVLAEPLACVVHAFDLVRDPAGLDVLVYGGGTIGLLAASVARALGASSVSVVELDAGRAANAEAAEFAAGSSADAFDQTDWALVADATGVVPAIRDGLSRLQRGGTLLQIGVAPPDAVLEVRPYELFQRELTITGSLTTRYSFPRALDLLARGAVDASRIVGEPFALADYAEAIATAGRGHTLKVTVAPGL